MRLLICGDRHWYDLELIFKTVHELPIKPEVVIEGEAQGADSIGRDIAIMLGIPVLKFPANWKAYGRAAGPKRNQQMLDEGKPDLVLAFHDDIGSSKGTKHMLSIAKRAGIETRLISH